MKIYLQINGIITKEDNSEFTEQEYDSFIDKFLELVENEKLSFCGGSGLYTEQELPILI